MLGLTADKTRQNSPNCGWQDSIKVRARHRSGVRMARLWSGRIVFTTHADDFLYAIALKREVCHLLPACQETM